MAKKALCVGINDYPYDGSDLNGCVNDALAWADLLVGHYDFAEAVFTPRHMTPDELEEGVAQIYLHTTSRLASSRRALHSLAETGSLRVSVVGYLWNRGYGSLCVRKYRSTRNASPVRAARL